MGRADRFVESGDSFVIGDGICNRCRHVNPGIASCAAYPHGIPAEVLDGTVQHTKPYKNDKGIVFEPVEDEYAG